MQEFSKMNILRKVANQKYNLFLRIIFFFEIATYHNSKLWKMSGSVKLRYKKLGAKHKWNVIKNDFTIVAVASINNIDIGRIIMINSYVSKINFWIIIRINF